MKKDQQEQNAREVARIFASNKEFADNARVLVAEGHILLVLYSGGDSEIFALTPHHAKRLSQLLSTQIQMYEAQQGPIAASFPANVISPIQPETPLQDGDSKSL